MKFNLADLRVISVSGPDSSTFLQGQLTQDVTLATGNRTVLAGWADAKGRLLLVGHLFRQQAEEPESLALLIPESLADATIKRLRMYVLRAKVQIALLECSVVGVMGDLSLTAATSAQTVLGLAHDADRRIVIAPPMEVGATAAMDEQSLWSLADVRAGIPAVVAATSGEFVPQMLNLDLLDAISYTKGCYTGQEIVARTRYLGRVKRRMLRFAAAAPAPAAGAAIHAARGVVGQVVLGASTATGCELLAVTYLDDLQGPLFLDPGGALPLARLDLPYDIPELAPR